MVSNAHKVPVEIIPRLADSNAHVLTHQAVLTFSYFLKHFFIPVLSVPECLFKMCTYESAMSFLLILPAFLGMCAGQQSVSWPRSWLCSKQRACSTYCSPSFIALTIIRHVRDLEPSGTVPFIGLKLNPQLLGSGGEGDGTFVGLAGLICRHRIG